MREILFKAKTEDKSRWVEGSLVILSESDYRIVTKEDVSLAYTSGSNYDGDMIGVDPSTICQYTGLTDNNGNKIWENDIVKHYNNPNKPTQFVIGAIYWNEDNVRYERSSKYEYAKFSVLYDCVYEVIGNIFDNPELLKEE